MVRICHLSDIHLSPMPHPSPADLVGKRVTGWLNWQRKRRHQSSRKLLDALVGHAKTHKPDHWALTGDLVNIALEAEMEQAGDWLAALAPPERVSVVCGNHDAYVPGGLSRAADLWGRYLHADSQEFSDLPSDWKSFDALYPMVQRVGDVALVLVNTGKPTAPFRATGVASGKQLRRLEATLTQLGKDGLCRVVMIHHPPFAAAAHRHKRMIGAARFRQVISDTGAELILHGHTHLDTIEAVTGPYGPVSCLCVPAAAQMPGHKRPPAAFNRLDVSRASDGWQMDLARIGLAADATDLTFQTLHEQRFVQPFSG